MKVLIVDDFQNMRQVVVDSLKSIGCEEIFEAEDGFIALKKLKEEAFDLVISDWHMPNMSGLELVKEMRATLELNKVPVLMITSEAKRDLIIAVAKAGANGYILKPFTPEVLKEKVDKILSSRTSDKKTEPAPNVNESVEQAIETTIETPAQETVSEPPTEEKKDAS